MKCKQCNETEVIKINKLEHVKYQCQQGHMWTEEYVDNGGIHTRPKSYNLRIEDILFPKEKKLYQKVADEIEKNEDFFAAANAKEIMNYMVKKCGFSKEEIYKLFKKITQFNNKVKD
ncbi:hypothetical protein [Natronincola ferrireducens]|uniref:Uncharacterized protein n=1 Tax=Natronincola ferrireducens TaxID=393762 RepID=A0A1G8YWU9_9FIRM|nr:hypothetical protein [Natronincola ferrireducens]SDK07261.1 hypothetical protein SAMN05660472_00670 [Natronincola ferrireducens]